MILTKAAVGSYRSINTSQSVAIDPDVTVLVGMNEAGSLPVPSLASRVTLSGRIDPKSSASTSR